MSVSRVAILELLNIFNDQYQLQNKSDPRQGYLVQFFVKDHGIKALLHSYGEKRKSNELLSGISQVRDSCIFCPQKLSESPLKLRNITKRNTTDAVQSLSGQLLIVPKTHYSQWFDAPIELQADLLQEAIDIRKQYPESQNSPIELHCGSAAGQTIYHIHVRTNVKIPTINSFS